MTLPLQPMPTAPRDGSEVLLKIDPAIWGNVEINTVSAWWNALLGIWVARGDQYRDHHFSGWLDLPALARDAERLDYLEREIEIGRRLLAHTDQIIDPLFLREEPITRATIDKEMERG